MPGITASASTISGSGRVKRFAIGIVEPDRDVPRHLNVLFLVPAHGHNVALVEKDIGCHEHRIGEEAVARRNVFRNSIFVSVAALKKAHCRDIVQIPGELGDLGHVRLHPEN